MLHFDFLNYFYRIYKIYLYNKQELVDWLSGDHLVFWDLGLMGQYFMRFIRLWPTTNIYINFCAAQQNKIDGYVLTIVMN